MPTLVDCGMAYADNQERLVEAIDRTLGGRVDQLVLTHAHIDHVGLAGWVRERYGCRVLVHPADRRILEAYPELQLRIVDRYREPYTRAGLPAELLEEAAEMLVATGRFWHPVTADGELADGDRIDAGDSTWTVRHLPGHSPGLIAITREDGTMLAGDLLIADLTTNAFFDDGRPEQGPGLGNHLDSLRRLAEIGPARVGPGHRGWIEDPCAVVETQLTEIEARLDSIAATLTGVAVRPFELIGAIYGPLGRGTEWLAVADLIGALELLVRRGRAISHADGYAAS